MIEVHEVRVTLHRSEVALGEVGAIQIDSLRVGLSLSGHGVRVVAAVLSLAGVDSVVGVLLGAEQDRPALANASPRRRDEPYKVPSRRWSGRGRGPRRSSSVSTSNGTRQHSRRVVVAAAVIESTFLAIMVVVAVLMVLAT